MRGDELPARAQLGLDFLDFGILFRPGVLASDALVQLDRRLRSAPRGGLGLVDVDLGFSSTASGSSVSVS